MTSFIVVSKDREKCEQYLKDFYNKYNIDVFDVAIVEQTTNTSSIGIEDIKNMQKKIFLKPIKSKTKAVVLESAQLLTTEAQNAMLKILEEPPDHTLIILTTDSKEALLPTIISRCKIIELQNEKPKLSQKEKEEIETFLNEFPKWGIGERLKKAETLSKDKQQATEWIERLIMVAREQLLTSSNNTAMRQLSSEIKSFQQLHTLLKTTNVNTRFAIENTFLQLT